MVIWYLECYKPTSLQVVYYYNAFLITATHKYFMLHLCCTSLGL